MSVVDIWLFVNQLLSLVLSQLLDFVLFEQGGIVSFRITKALQHLITNLSICSYSITSQKHLPPKSPKQTVTPN